MQKNYDLLTETTRKPQLCGALCTGFRVLKPLQNTKPFRWLPAILTLTLSLLMGQTWAQTYKYERFTADGTWIVPANANTVIIDCWGGGGGGATSTSGEDGQQGGGGGGGGFARYQISNASSSYSGTTLSVVVGAGGTANNNGGTSSVAISGQPAFLSATGGLAGGLQTGGDGGVGSGSSNTNWNKTGGKGGNGLFHDGMFDDYPYAGGGGGAAGYSGTILNPTFQNGGDGGDGTWSGWSGSNGSGGAGYASVGTGSSGNGTKGSNSSSDNKDGIKYGGGGGGGADGSSRNPNAGGAGAPGYVLITYTLNCTVTLNANGGSFAPSATTTFTCVQGTAYGNNLSAIPTKEGYAFVGWFTDPTGGTKVETSTICPDQDAITLYAHYVGQPGTTVENTYSPESTGDYSWPAPLGTYKVTIEAWGGGGAGGNATSNYSVGSGGGGGAYVKYTAVGYNFYNGGNAAISGVVGAGATTGTNAQNAKATTITGVGIPTGLQANAGGNGEMKGNPNKITTLTANGGTGGSKSTIAGVVSFEGGTGGSATTKRYGGSTRTVSASGAGGKGGNTAGTQTDGGGGGGQSISNNNNGNRGFAPGGGGSGARRSGNSGDYYYGGAGGNGKVVITYEVLKIAITRKYQDGTTPDSKDSILYYTNYDLGTPSRAGYSFEGWYDAAVDGNLFPTSGTYTDTTSKIVYAHWEILPGAIANVDTTINPCTNAHVRNLTLPSDNNGYKWTCTYNSTTDTIYGKGATLDTVLSVPGTYAFHRFVVSPITGKSVLSGGTYTVTVRDYNAGTLSVDNNSIYLCGSYAISQTPAQIINGNGNFSYKWTYKKDNEAETNLSVSTASLTTEQHPALTVPAAYTFYRYARPAACATENMYKKDSVVVTLNHTNPGTITYNGGDIYPCGNFSITGSEVTSSSSTISYKWTCNGDSVANTQSISQTDVTLTVAGTYTFIRYVKSDCGNEAWQSNANGTCTITVTPIPNGTIAANPTTIVSRNTYAITGSDAGEQFTYHWAYKKQDASNYTEISGATGKDLSNAPVLSAPGTYEFIRYTLISGCDCQAGTATCNVEVKLESGEVCFSDPGDTTWTAPEGTWKITNIEAWGAGGGGGSAPGQYQGSGGGGGAYAVAALSTPQNFHGGTILISVGQGGAAETSGGASVLNFNGIDAVNAGGGGAGSHAYKNNQAIGGAAGVVTAGSTGGYSATSGQNKQRGDYTSGAGGAGANGGDGGAGRGSADDGDGHPGNPLGGGGGGARNANDNTNYIGGAGARGQVCLTYEILELQLITNNNYDNAQPDTILILYYDTLPANPTREGYVFAGWYDAPTGGNLVTFDSTGNYALYNHTEDLSLYAQWAVDAGSIATNTGAQRICKEGNYAITGSTVNVPNVTYSWKYTLYKSDGTSSTNDTSVNQPSLSPDYFVLEEPGLYEFTRFVDAADDNFGPQTSANTFKINVVAPNQTIEGLDVNYPQICDGGKVELTPNMELANITLPVFDDPSRDTTIEAESVSYQYSIGGASWNTYQNNITALKQGEPLMRAVFSYENLEGCYAYSKQIPVTVHPDPQFSSEISISKEKICPNETIILTAGELSDPEIVGNPPYNYTWKRYDDNEGVLVDLETEAVCSYDQNGKVAYVSNSQVTGEIYYVVLAENALGCSAQSYSVESGDGDLVPVYIEEALPPVVSKMVTCPNPGETFVFENNVTADYELVWYANISTMNSEDTIPNQSLANEDTVVWYVAQNYESCISARVPDTLVIRYTSHIAQTSESSTLQQEVCQFTDITPITFQFDGNAYPEYTGTLPAGVKAVIDTNAQTYTISGTPTVDGNFDFTVKLQNTGDCPQPATFDGTITVNPSPHTTVYFSSCDHESVTIGEETFNTPGTYIVRLSSSAACDSVVTLIYTETFFNKFGYGNNQEELLAGWTNFNNVPAKTGTINSDITSVYGGTISYSGWKGSNIKCGNLTSSSLFINASGNSLGLVNGSSGDDLNNGKSIILKTSTKGYDDVNLHFDYGAERYHWTAFVEVWSTTDIAFSTISFAYSFDGENYETVPDQLVVYFGEQELTTGSYGLNFKELLPNNVLANKNDVYVKITFDGASRSSELISSQYFRLDNIAFTGVKAIDTIGILIAGGDSTVCTNSEVNLTATPPYIQLDDYDVPIDTMEITYTWERIYNGVSDTVQLGATYDDHILVDAETGLEEGWYKYVVSVGKGDCLLSDTMDVYRLKPIYNEDDTVRGVVCSNQINNITDIEFLNGFEYQEGMAIVETSMEELAVPGIHLCKLSIPIDDNKCGEVRTLELNVKRAFDTTIVENICLGETYNKYGIEFTPEVEGITYRQSDFTCANGCDSIYRVTLITNSVEASLTDQYNITLAEWDMAKGRNNFRPTNGTRTQNATFMVNTPGNAPSFENVNGHTPSEDYSYREGNGALMWPNLFSTCSAAGTAASATEYQGVYFEIALNPKDYTNLKAKFDYKRENATTNNAQAFDNVNYSYKIGEGGTYSTPQSKTISGTDWSPVIFDFSGADTQDEDIIYLKFEFTGGNKGASEYCGSGLAAFVSGSRYLPSYITIDNMKIWGDKPARATLDANPTATYIPTGSDAQTTVAEKNEISICRDAEVTFTIQQKDSVYFTFFVRDPNDEDTAFGGLTTMTLAPQTTGDYYIVAHDNITGCDSLYTFPVVVNEYAVIADSTAPYICSGAPLAFAPSDAPENTTYSWEAPTSRHIDFNTLKPGANQDSLRAALSSDTTSIISVVYNLTPSTGGCVGSPFKVTVNVLPEVTSQVTKPTDLEGCHGTEKECAIRFSNIKSTVSRQVVWEFNGASEAVPDSSEGILMDVTRTVSLPDTPCDTTYKLYATYTDGAGCIAKDSIALKVDIPAHSFTFAAADKGSTVYCLTDASKPASALVPKAYSGCGDTLTGDYVGFVDDPTTITCSGTRTYTYKYTDCKGQDTTWQYVYTISPKAPEMKENAVWPDDSVNQPKIFAQADTSCLYNDAQVKDLYQDNCGGANFTVTHVQVDSSTANSGWKITRTYTIANSCGDTVMPKPTMSVSGSDQTPPTYTCPADTVAYLAIDGTVLSDTSKTGTPTNVTDDSGNKCDTTYRDEPYTYACGVSFNRIWRVTDACGNVSLSDSVQKITVKDTLTPRINGTWKNDTVYLTAYNACGYTLPDTLKTVVQVNTLKEGFIKGQNLKPAITMTQDTTNKGACDMYILRTYTVTDTCSTKSATFTHKISVKDTTKPALAGSWPANITGQNHIYAEADTSELKSDADIKALFNDCHNITVTHTQAPTLVSNCGWTIVRTYHIEDACHNGFDSTMSVSGANQNAPMRLADTWPTGASNVNTCLTNPDTSSLKADTAIAKLFSDTCGVYVTHKDSVVVGSNNCNWTIIRTYFVQDSCHNFVTPNPELRVSGSDQSAPVLTDTWPANPETVQNACLANADKSGLKSNADIKALFEDCGTFDVTSKDDTTGTSCNWTITRTYTVKDSCGNIYYTSGIILPTMSVSGKDTSAPVFAEDKEWPANLSNLNFCKKDVPAGPTKAYIKTLFTDCNDLLVDSSYVVKGSDCDWTAHYIYKVSDSCDNSFKDTVTYTGSDQTAPTLTGTWPSDSSNINKSKADIPAGPTKAEIKALFTDCADITVDSVRNVTGTDCDWTAKFCYQIKDNCHTVYDTVTYTGGDNEKPKFVCPKDTTLNLTVDGTVYASPENTGKPTEVSDNYTLEANMNIYHIDKDTTVDCGNTFYFTREWHVADTCGNDSVKTQKITVADTMKPTLAALTWTDSTVYLKIDTTYTLPNAFTTIAEVNGKVAGFIKGNNLDPNLTMVADTQNRNTCGLQVVRTYTVTDICNHKTSSFTHKILVEDTLIPEINGNWADSTVYLTAACGFTLPTPFTTVSQLNTLKPNFISGPNLVENVALKVVADTNNVDTCGWNVVRTYDVKDSCSNKTKSFTHTIYVKDTIAPVLAEGKVWLKDSLNQNRLFANAYIAPLADNDSVKKLFHDCTNLTVTHKDDTLADSDCGWKIRRTYTITDDCNNKKVDSVFIGGSDQTKPVINCKDVAQKFYTDVDKDSLTNNSDALNVVANDNNRVDTITYSLSGATTGNGATTLNGVKFNTGKTLVEWTVTDDCGNDTTCVDTVKIYNNKSIAITSGSKTWDYDGNAHTFPSYTVTFGGVSMPRTADDSTKFVLSTGDTLSVTPDPSASVTVYTTATQNNTFTYVLQNDEYYTGRRDSTFGTINVNGYPQSIHIASVGKTWTYDGQEHRYQKYTVEFGNTPVQPLASDTTKFVLPTPTSDTLTITSTASITNVGKVTNTFAYTLTNDVIYVGPRDTVFDTLRVTPLTGVEVKVVGHFDTTVYNGLLHTVTGYELSTENILYNVADVTYNGTEADTTATRRYADKTEMTMTQGMFANNNPNFADMVFNITQGYMFVKPIDANIQITAKSTEKNYDGTPLTNDGFDYTMDGSLVAGDTVVATVAGFQTEVGSSDNVITEYYVLRKKSANQAPMLLMASPSLYDTITNCYTFATPATVAGTLRVNNAFVVVRKDSVDVDCYGNHNGTATIVVEGGKLVNDKYQYTVAGPNSYSVIDSIGTTLELTGLYPGAYTVTFKDGLDSTLTATFSINQPDTMVAEIAAPEELCPNQGSYPVSVTVTGGNGTNAYVWGSNATNADAASTVVAQIGASDCRTEYTAAVQVTDAKGCVAKDTVKFTVVDNEAPVFTVPGDITICRNADGQIDAPTSVTGVPSNYSDNCSNEATLIRHTQWLDLDTVGSANTLMVIHRQWTVTDSCDNSTVKVQNITVKPGIGVAGSNYVLTAPENIEITLKYGQVDTLLTNIGSAVASNLPTGIDAPVVTDNRPANNRYNEGTTVVIWTATDECGFTVTATQTIVVNYPLCEPVTYEGYEYPAVRVGGNCWLAENLHNTKYADGADVPEYSSYNNDGNMTDDYGLLYSWYSAVRVSENDDNATPTATIDGYIQGLCPENWAIPTQAEYNNLFETAGTTGVLKDLNAQFWLPGAAGTTPNTGFNARGTGFYDSSIDRYMNLLGEAYFWTSDLGATVTQGKCSVITHFCPELINQNQDKGMGFSVRCVRKK